MIEILKKIFSCFTGVFVSFTPPVFTYNAWRFINPIRIETAVQATEYGSKMLKRYFPQKDLPGDEDEDYPYVDYTKFPVLTVHLDPSRWVVYYEKDDDDDYSRCLGCKPSSPIIMINPNTGVIHFPLRGK